MAIAKQARTESWQVNALVDATPISGPASVGRAACDFARDRRSPDVDDRRDALAVGLAIAKRRQRVGGLARLRNENSQAAFRERRLAIAHLGSDIDVDRHACKPFDPVLRNEAGVVGRAAGRDRDAADFRQIDTKVGEIDACRHHVEIIGERVRDDLRLLVNFLGHEVAVVALVHQQGTGDGFDDRAIDTGAVAIENLGTGASQYGPVAFLEIGDGVSERRQRDGVGTEIHFTRAMTDCEWRALAGRDHQIVMAGEDDAESEGALQLLQCLAHGGDRCRAAIHFVGNQMNDGFRIGVGLEAMSLGLELGAQVPKVLDDAVVDDGDLRRHMRMCVALGRTAVGCPARVSDAGPSGKRLDEQALFEIAQFAFGTAAFERAGFDGRDPG